MVFEKELTEAIVDAFKAKFGEDIDAGKVSIQPTRKEFEGSHTFVIFPFLKITKKGPEESGKEIGSYLVENTDLVADFNTVKGFLNLVLAPEQWLKLFGHAYEQEDFGRAISNGKKVMVEFSSPNTNKPLHLGHLRNNFLGDSVSRILDAAGYEVMKTNLVNDRGIHICKSMLAYQKFGAGETPETSGIKGDHLVGKYYVVFDQHYKEEIKQLVSQGKSEEEAKKEAPLILAAQEMLRKWEEKDPEVYGLWEKMNGWVYEGFNATYDSMGISFDKIYKESDTYLLGKDIVEEGLEKDVFFKKDNNSVWVDLSDEKLDEKLVLRGDGTSVYITQDMGTCDLKYNDFPFDQSVYVVGNEQDYHFKVLFSIMNKLGRSYSDGLYHLSYGMVDLPSGKMKSREGTVVDADDLIQEMKDTAEQHTRELGKIEGMSEEEAHNLYDMLALGALKYFLLKVDPKKRMLFNPAESIEFQGHTGPFVQYTHARISSILRRGKTLEYQPALAGTDIQIQPREMDVIQKLMEFPETVQTAAKEYSPSLIAQYVFDLAKEYNGFYQDIPIFNEKDRTLVEYRMALSALTARVLSAGMGLLGINVPERM
jgi:arginyl-tRNA synthetase